MTRVTAATGDLAETRRLRAALAQTSHLQRRLAVVVDGLALSRLPDPVAAMIRDHNRHSHLLAAALDEGADHLTDSLRST
ncbi:MAG: hypothetical protein IPJ61_17765 [Tessaracoccus sp.]|uniref:hypothetical protein n=1 Tax=Tessaracoccus sp. TaxID=1971211 RepID=UPI001EB8C6EB|nr:hypothetical protein [Tessaracoccus sp.]MBK7822852.1 hypothetical protein [Tessaracoccus sp.]